MDIFMNICNHGLWHVMILYLAFSCLDVDSLHDSQPKRTLQCKWWHWNLESLSPQVILNCQRTLLTFKDKKPWGPFKSGLESSYRDLFLQSLSHKSWCQKRPHSKKSFMDYACYWTRTYFVQSSLHKYYKIDTSCKTWECPIKNLMNGNCNQMDFPSPNHHNNIQIHNNALWD